MKARLASSTDPAPRLYTLLCALCLAACAGIQPALGADTAAEATLRQRDSAFDREIVQVSPGVYTAVGFSPANISMIVGSDGVVIVDTGLSVSQATEVAARFRAITDKPVKAIIYTHAHGDHTGGSGAFIGEEKPQIWALANFGSEYRPLAAAGLTIQRQRGTRQAGFELPARLRINNGVAPAMQAQREDAFVAEDVATAPTHTFVAGRKSIEVAGLQLDLVAAPGETDDQLYVWFERQRVLFAGDNYYRSFPNLYAIRGTPYRDVRAWADSLTLMLAEQPAAVVPGHTRPVIGGEAAQTALRQHRDAIRYVHDKTVEGMNLGLTPDQLVDYVQLPPDLADNADLGEYYGSVAFAVRSIFNGYLGWYDGNPTRLRPLSPAGEARRWSQALGGQDKLRQLATAALADGDAQWAAQLADQLLALDAADAGARELKADALTALARESVNAPARNYYLSVAQALREPGARDRHSR
ncbi:MAG: alkyl sulfatase [Halioglobus sp.]|nr:alkyl sulfatase [Halioglobus sp.]|tara:strand:+ start:649 stop:2061 length:1413 start_codon:yes stop_codon:yes gene_type:complete